jgi:TonB family protein
VVKLTRLISLTISVFLLGPLLHAGDTFSLRVKVYHGRLMEDASPPQTEMLWRASQEPLLSSLCEFGGVRDSEWSANVVKALFDLVDLETANELFTTSKTWNGRSNEWLDRFLGEDVVFRLETSAKRRPDKGISFRAAVFRSKEGVIPQDEGIETKARRALEARSDPKKMDKIFERTIELEVGDPVVICAPWKEGVLFFVVGLAQDLPQPKPEASKANGSSLKIIAPPLPLKGVQPYYPESLRNRRIEGKVGMLVAVDKSGAVIGIKVTEPVHPYLDYSAVQTLLRERFEPVLRNGKPVEAVFPYEFNFERLVKPRPEGGDRAGVGGAPAPERLVALLAGCADYSRSLAGSMLDYVCEETINEIDCRLRANPQQELDYIKTFFIKRTNLGPVTGAVSAPLTIMDPQLTRRTRYICDYQIVKDEDVVKERRIILRKGGRKVSEGTILEDKRYSLLMPILAGNRILAAERQGLFTFRLAGESRIQGKECDIMEARPNSGNEEGIESAKIWIAKKDHHILKCEIEGVPIEGFEEVLTDCVRLGVHPRFITTYEYGANYRSVSLPSRTAVRIEYPISGSRGGLIVKATIDMKYSKFRYFGVNTEHQVIK